MKDAFWSYRVGGAVNVSKILNLDLNSYIYSPLPVAGENYG